MRFATFAWFFLIALVTIDLTHLALAAAPDAPTMDQIQQDYEAKKYQDVIRETTQALPLTNDPSKGYDKAALLALKGESHLQLKQIPQAAEEYAAAAKEAKDPATADLYRATAALIKKSPGGNYHPRQPSTHPSAESTAAGGRPEPINIIDMKNRREAMDALFNDEAKVVGAKVESLKRQNSLSRNLMEGIKEIGELRGIEMVATGKDQTSSQMLSGVSDHVNELINGALKQMGDTVDKLSSEANKTEPRNMTMADGNVYTMNVPKGLNSQEKTSLANLARNAKDIAATCDDLAKAVGPQQGASFANTKQQADALAKKAEDLAQTNFEPDLNQLPKNVQNPNNPRGTMGTNNRYNRPPQQTTPRSTNNR